MILGIILAILLTPEPVYGEVFKGCDSRYYVKWNNITKNFDLQMTGNLLDWTNLVEIRNNQCMQYFSHPLENTNHVGFYRLLIYPLE